MIKTAMLIPPAERLDAINIGLMLLSALVAIIIPFELFLFSYAILGPLHYLTEISWLHDRNYYTRGRYDALFLLVIGICIAVIYFSGLYGFIPVFNKYAGTQFVLHPDSTSGVLWVAVLASLLFATVKGTGYRVVGFMVIVASLSIASWSNVALALCIFLPTLIHVYIFTGVFMLYGALKSGSRLGLVSVAVLALCPLLLFTVLPDVSFKVSGYGMQAYIGGPKNIGFIGLHVQTLSHFFDYNPDPVPHNQQDYNYWLNAVFNTRTSILVARFIAFAYTYHYLNWFSKTNIIKWHWMPRKRFAVIVICWIVCIAFYVKSYTLGLQCLFLLSYMHVLLELPLNFTSAMGVGKSIVSRISGT